MKYKLFALLLIFALVSNANAQLPIDKKTGEVVFSDVVRIKGKTKEELFNESKHWMSTNLKSSKKIIEIKGEDTYLVSGAGKIIIQNGEVKYLGKATLNFNFKIICKKNRIKYYVDSFLITREDYTSTLNPIKQLWPDTVGIDPKKRQERFEHDAKYVVKRDIDALIINLVYSIKEKEKWEKKYNRELP